MKKLKLNIQELNTVEILTREQLKLVIGGNQYLCKCNATYFGGASTSDAAQAASMGTAGQSQCTNQSILAISCSVLTTSSPTRLLLFNRSLGTPVRSIRRLFLLTLQKFYRIIPPYFTD